MKALQEAGRSNMIYGLIQCVALPDSAGHPTRLPLNRMPTGCIEHQINFFNANHCYNVIFSCPYAQHSSNQLQLLVFQVPKCPVDYEEWLVTMYAELGTKWHCLHNGPAWHHDEHTGVKTNMVPGNVCTSLLYVC